MPLKWVRNAITATTPSSKDTSSRDSARDGSVGKVIEVSKVILGE